MYRHDKLSKLAGNSFSSFHCVAVALTFMTSLKHLLYSADDGLTSDNDSESQGDPSSASKNGMTDDSLDDPLDMREHSPSEQDLDGSHGRTAAAIDVVGLLLP